MKQVVIRVQGGAADIAYASEGVEIAIVDLDAAAAEGVDGKRRLRYWVARARRDDQPKKYSPLPRDGGYCGACGKTMHIRTRLQVAHHPEADHIFCMWCDARLRIAPPEPRPPGEATAQTAKRV